MKETIHINSDLLKNMARWVVLLLLILLVATPHLRQGQRDTQPVAFGNAVALANECRTESCPGAWSPGIQADSYWNNEEIPIEAGTESEWRKSSSSGVPSPMVPVEDRADPVFRGITPRPAALHISASSRKLQPAGESKSNGPSNEKEKSANPYDGIIRKAAERYQVDPALVKAIIMAESSYNPKAVSRKGAQGLMQLMPGTARALGVKDSFDPEHNIDAGVRYFRKLLDQFDGDVKLAIAAYNAGSRKVRMYNGIPPFKHTRYYVAKVIEYHQRYQQ